MAILEPIFNDTVWTPLWLTGAVDSDTDIAGGNAGAANTDQGTMDTPALRPPENPFKTLMKKIDELAEGDNIHDIRNALYMVHDALDEKRYSCDQEHRILTDRWLTLHERLQTDDPAFAVRAPAQTMNMAA